MKDLRQLRDENAKNLDVRIASQGLRACYRHGFDDGVEAVNRKINLATATVKDAQTDSAMWKKDCENMRRAMKQDYVPREKVDVMIQDINDAIGTSLSEESMTDRIWMAIEKYKQDVTQLEGVNGSDSDPEGKRE